MKKSRKQICVVCPKCHQIVYNQILEGAFLCIKCNLVYEDRTLTSLGKFVDTSSEYKPGN